MSFSSVSVPLLMTLWAAVQSEQTGQTPVQNAPQAAPPAQATQAPSTPRWQYGGVADLRYLLDFKFPSNRELRSRGTGWHVHEPHLNKGAVYGKKKTTEESR